MVKRNAERKNQAEYEMSCGLVVSELDSTLLSNKGINGSMKNLYHPRKLYFPLKCKSLKLLKCKSLKVL